MALRQPGSYKRASTGFLGQASVGLYSAIGRIGSRGSHAREGFPKRDELDWLKHTNARLDGEGQPRFDYRPVHLKPQSNEVSSIPPKERLCQAMRSPKPDVEI